MSARIHLLTNTATGFQAGDYIALDNSAYTEAKKLEASVLQTAIDLDGLTPTDGNFIVGNGSAWVAESGATALASIGAAAASHTHAAGDIASGTLVHERGGLEADVSAYAGLVKISGGSTSAVTVTAFGESLIDDADASTARTTLGLGTMATQAATSYLAATGATTGATSQAQAFTNGVVTGAIKPASDSTTALQMQNSSGTAVVTVDTSNSRASVGNVTPAARFHIKSGSTSNSNLALLVENSAGTDAFNVADDGRVSVGSKGTQPYAFEVNEGAYNGVYVMALVDSASATLKLSPSSIDSSLTDFTFGANSAGAAIYMAAPSNYALGVYGTKIALGWGGIGTPTAGADIVASSTSAASLRIRAGTAPTSPNAGDVWYTTATGFTFNGAGMTVDQSSATGAVPVLLLDQADDDQDMIEFTGTVGVGNAIEAVGAKTLTTTHFIKCTITGVGNVYIPVGTIA